MGDRNFAYQKAEGGGVLVVICRVMNRTFRTERRSMLMTRGCWEGWPPSGARGRRFEKCFVSNGALGSTGAERAHVKP